MSEQRRARTAADGLGDGPVSNLMERHLTRQNVAMNHGLAEGFVPDHDAVWRSYDRVEHPWMHGRRAADLIEKLKGVTGRGE